MARERDVMDTPAGCGTDAPGISGFLVVPARLVREKLGTCNFRLLAERDTGNTPTNP